MRKDEGLLSSTDGTLLELVARELERLAAASAEYGGGPAGMAAQLLRTIEGGGGVPPAPDRSIDAERLKAYLARSGLVSPEARLRPRLSALGFSKDTFLIDVEEPGRAPHVLVIRRDLPAGPTPYHVVDEFPLLKLAFDQGLKVAEPLRVEPDPGVLERPLIVMRGAPGRPDYLSWTKDPAEQKAIAGQLATFLARLHTLPVETAPLPRCAPGASPRGELAAYFREWRGFWRDAAPPGFEHIDEAYALIERDLPEIEALAVVHADFGFHNILVDQGKIAAVLDWEFAHLGEPEEDLAYARRAIEALVSWDEFLEGYHAAGGPAISPARVRAYEIWRGVRNATCCAVSRKAVESGLNADFKLAYAGRVLIKTFAEDVAAQLAREPQ